MNFNGVFVNVKRSWPSGANDAQILPKAQKVYRKKKLSKILFFGMLRRTRENGSNNTHRKTSRVVRKESKHLKMLIVNLQMHMFEWTSMMRIVKFRGQVVIWEKIRRR